MEIWEVFQQKGSHDPYVHVGSVLAPDSRMAIIYAKECFYRRLEGRGLWVARRADIESLKDGDLLEQAVDKSYRYPSAYRGVVQKREKARARAVTLTGRSEAAPRGKAVASGEEF